MSDKWENIERGDFSGTVKIGKLTWRKKGELVNLIHCSVPKRKRHAGRSLKKNNRDNS